MSTKDRILEAAVDLFAEKGYNDVSIREITRAVGIKESSLYNHFASKQMILDEIFDIMRKKYEDMTPSKETAADMLEKLSSEEFLEMGIKAFQLYMGDPLIIKIWRIISIERFRNDRAKEFFINELMDNPIHYQASIFEMMMKKGLIKESDSLVLAREFYSYILYIYFRFFETEPGKDPVNDPEIQKMIADHMLFMGRVIQK